MKDKHTRAAAIFLVTHSLSIDEGKKMDRPVTGILY